MANKLKYIESLVKEYECGIIYDAKNELTIAEAANKLCGSNGFLQQTKSKVDKLGKRYYNWEHFEPEFLKIFSDTLQK